MLLQTASWAIRFMKSFHRFHWFWLPMLQESANMLLALASHSKLENSPCSGTGVALLVCRVQLEQALVHIWILEDSLTNSGGTEARRVWKSLVILVPSRAELCISSYSCWIVGQNSSNLALKRKISGLIFVQKSLALISSRWKWMELYHPKIAWCPLHDSLKV